MINVTVGQKGGVGKTTISNHILPYLTNSNVITEIDNNNFSSIYFGLFSGFFIRA